MSCCNTCRQGAVRRTGCNGTVQLAVVGGTEAQEGLDFTFSVPQVFTFSKENYHVVHNIAIEDDNVSDLYLFI